MPPFWHVVLVCAPPRHYATVKSFGIFYRKSVEFISVRLNILCLINVRLSIYLQKRNRLTRSDSNLANIDPVDASDSNLMHFFLCFSAALADDDVIVALLDVDMTSSRCAWRHRHPIGSCEDDGLNTVRLRWCAAVYTRLHCRVAAGVGGYIATAVPAKNFTFLERSTNVAPMFAERSLHADVPGTYVCELR